MMFYVLVGMLISFGVYYVYDLRKRHNHYFTRYTLMRGYVDDLATDVMVNDKEFRSQMKEFIISENGKLYK